MQTDIKYLSSVLLWSCPAPNTLFTLHADCKYINWKHRLCSAIDFQSSKHYSTCVPRPQVPQHLRAPPPTHVKWSKEVITQPLPRIVALLHGSWKPDSLS